MHGTPVALMTASSRPIYLSAAARSRHSAHISSPLARSTPITASMLATGTLSITPASPTDWGADPWSASLLSVSLAAAAFEFAATRDAFVRARWWSVHARDWGNADITS